MRSKVGGRRRRIGVGGRRRRIGVGGAAGIAIGREVPASVGLALIVWEIKHRKEGRRIEGV